jgi:hypothetical protein
MLQDTCLQEPVGKVVFAENVLLLPANVAGPVAVFRSAGSRAERRDGAGR